MPRIRPILTAALLALAALTPSANAQFVPQLPRLRGTISYIAPNHRCFTLLDRNGNQLTVNLNDKTRYYFGHDSGSFLDVMEPGDEVFVHIDPASSLAADVTNPNRYNRPATPELKSLLNLSDDDCLVIVPALSKVLSLQQLVDGNLRGSDINNMRRNLLFQLRNPNTPDSDLRNTLNSLRQARQSAQRQLTKARQDLTSLLTLRQEATLLQEGILE
ncbi:MAG: hypothetical protein ACTHN5_11515 [Phycisphaerae bacterium]